MDQRDGRVPAPQTVSAPTAEERQLAAIAEHDKDFPPQHTGETDAEFLARSLRENRQSHQGWIDHSGEWPQPVNGADPLGGVEYQRVAVARYDRLIQIADALLAAEREKQELRRLADNLAKSMGHSSTCRFLGCNCGAAQEQAIALGQYRRFQHEAEALLGRKP